MPAYTFYYTQNKVSYIPDELINDIKQLFINLYGKSKFNEIYEVNRKIKTFDKVYVDTHIVRLNNKKIYIRIECGWFIIDINKEGELICDPDDSDYEILVNCLLMLCIYYNVIENKWENDNKTLDKTIINKCKKELYKLGFNNISVKFNDKDKYYYLEKIIK